MAHLSRKIIGTAQKTVREMWRYKDVTRAEFEKRKSYAEQVLVSLGAARADMEPDCPDKCSEEAAVYQYGDWYYRVDEVLFPEKPFIVFEAARSMDEVRRNVMEDADPFPYDLPDDEIREEIWQMISFSAN